MKKELTNLEYSKTKGFVDLYELAGVKPTRRQASKFRMGLGSCYNANSLI